MVYYAGHRVLSENFVLRSEDILHFNQQPIFILEARPSKTGRGEGGLLCLRKNL